MDRNQILREDDIVENWVYYIDYRLSGILLSSANGIVCIKYSIDRIVGNKNIADKIVFIKNNFDGIVRIKFSIDRII